MSIATGSPPHMYDLKVSGHSKLFSAATFAHVTNSADVSKTKPDPEVFIKSRDKFDPKPQSSSNCLVFEDAPNGVAAAVAAEMPVVMVPGPWIPDEMTKKADLVLKDLRDFKPELFGLPPFDYKPVKKVIFDFDGTLADTAGHYTTASIATLGRLGVTKEQLHKWTQKEYAAFSVKVGGRTPDVVIPAVIEAYNLKVTEEEFSALYDESLLPLLRSCKLLPGILKFALQQ